jgi:CMP-N-acetylneuraminic acid synthetase
LDALEKLESLGEVYTHVVLLQPTSPFRISEDIDRAWDLYVSSNAKTLVSVQSVNFIQPSNLYRSKSRIRSSSLIELQSLDPDSMTSPGTSRQDFSEMWWRNGAIYIFQSSLLRETQHLYHSPLVGFEMPWYRSINIDTVEDLRHAEIIARYLHN